MYSMDYLTEKFYLAVHDLTTGEGDARSRVGMAYRRFWLIPIEDYPQHMKKPRDEITKLLTNLKGREGFIIPDNLSKMKNKTASKISAHILAIYLGLVDIQSGNRPCNDKQILG